MPRACCTCGVEVGVLLLSTGSYYCSSYYVGTQCYACLSFVIGTVRIHFSSCRCNINQKSNIANNSVLLDTADTLLARRKTSAGQSNLDLRIFCLFCLNND